MPGVVRKPHIEPSSGSDVTGVILAGGRSTRMGRDKATLEIGGRTLFVRVLDMLSCFSSQLLIAGNRPDLATAEVPCVADIYPGSSLGGIHGGLSAARTPWIFVVPCDLAHPEPELVRFMLELRQGCEIVVPRTSEGFEPVFALYHKNCLHQMEMMLTRGEYRIYDLYNQTRVRYLDTWTLPAGWQRALLDLNTPEDLRRMSKED